MSIRRSSRLLTTLTSSSPTTSSLVPPYSHSQAIPEEPSPSLRPPYAHSSTGQVRGQGHKDISGNGQGKVVQPKLRYALLDRNVQEMQREKEGRYLAWAEGLGEETIQRVWQETLTALNQVHQDGTQVPEIPFHELAQHLTHKSTIKDLRRIGMVVVRDVIPDSDAKEVGEELRAYIKARGGHPAYWHDLLLALRSNPSLLSSNSQVMAALTGKESRYIRADTLGSIVSGIKLESVNLVKPWSSSGLSAQFTLSPSPTGSYQATPNIYSARYAALRPLFKARQSRISFYAKEGYLHPSNWVLNPITQSSSQSSENEFEGDLPHLSSSNVDLPELRAGDIIYTHPSLPIKSTSTNPVTGVESSDFIRVDPLSPSALAQGQVKAQREAYESGLPPPGIMIQGTVALEALGSKESLGSHGGRSAMGY